MFLQGEGYNRATPRSLVGLDYQDKAEVPGTGLTGKDKIPLRYQPTIHPNNYLSRIEHLVGLYGA